MTDHRIRCPVVVLQDFRERRDLSLVHIRAGPRGIPERRSPHRAKQLGAGTDIRELVAVSFGIIAVLATAAELIVEHFPYTVYPSAIGEFTRNRKDSRVVKFVIGEQGTVVTLGAAGFADE